MAATISVNSNQIVCRDFCHKAGSPGAKAATFSGQVECDLNNVYRLICGRPYPVHYVDAKGKSRTATATLLTRSEAVPTGDLYSLQLAGEIH